MGIINVTPDSFYKESRAINMQQIINKAGLMLAEGAAILDIGGQSTRPNSEALTAEAEAERVMPAIEAIVKAFPTAILSIDTYYTSVAKQAINLGAHIVNDVSGGSLDNKMINYIGAHNVPYICMHMRGNPQTMQSFANYKNVVKEVKEELSEKLANFKSVGAMQLAIDPGFGFAKTVDQNFELLQNLTQLKSLNLPILVGLSRKSMIYKTLDIAAGEALNGTTVLNSLALAQGVGILRVHDVREAVEAIILFNKFKTYSN
jgi:dihydropteroate synthase